MPATGTARKKIIVDFPTSLLQRTEQAAEQLSTDRSKVIRTAVEQFLGGLEKGEFEKELIAGYRANSKADRRIAAEFVNVDTEGI